jgi:hypothetical protein
VVGAHYPIADGSIIGEYRAYLRGLQARVAELKKQGKSSDETAEQVKGEFAVRYRDWAQPARITAAATVLYREE